MRRRSLAIVSGAFVATLAATPYFACNSITGINDYQVNCNGCLEGACGPELAFCQSDPTCCSASACFQSCAIEGNQGTACAGRCLHPDTPLSEHANAMLTCVFTNCMNVCFPGVAVGPDARIDDAGGCNVPEGGPPGDAPAFDAFTPLKPVTAPNCNADSQTASMLYMPPTPDHSKDYCIDATEVTGGQYQAFLDATHDGSDVGGQPVGCDFNTTYKPSASTGDPTLPARYVDWCDAFMYCKWAGKRLCGGMGGGSVDYGSPTDETVNQWFWACTSGTPGTHAYPYGATYVAGTCWDAQPTSPRPLPKAPRSMPGCKSDACFATPCLAVFDMSGNVAEWEDSCDGSSPTSHCHVRGGGAVSTSADASCNRAADYVRSDAADLIGFRCCAP